MLTVGALTGFGIAGLGPLAALAGAQTEESPGAGVETTDGPAAGTPSVSPSEAVQLLIPEQTTAEEKTAPPGEETPTEQPHGATHR